MSNKPIIKQATTQAVGFEGQEVLEALSGDKTACEILLSDIEKARNAIAIYEDQIEGEGKSDRVSYFKAGVSGSDDTVSLTLNRDEVVEVFARIYNELIDRKYPSVPLYGSDPHKPPYMELTF